MAGFRVATRHAVTRDEKDWVKYAGSGFGNPEPQVCYPGGGYPGAPPWAFVPPPPVPDWLPDVLKRLGLPTVDELRAMGEAGLLTRRESDE